MNPPGRLLGLDYGRVRIGVAISDALRISVAPYGFVVRETDAKAAAIVVALARKESVSGIVIGLPLHAGGQVGRSAKWAQDFAERLRAALSIPIATVDERYTSGEAEMQLRAEGAWPCAKGVVDAKAAELLLRRYLAGER